MENFSISTPPIGGETVKTSRFDILPGRHASPGKKTDKPIRLAMRSVTGRTRIRLPRSDTRCRGFGACHTDRDLEQRIIKCTDRGRVGHPFKEAWYQFHETGLATHG